MKNNLQVQTLKESIEFMHKTTIWYFSLLKDTDVLKVFEANGQKINSLYWLTAHIAFYENKLLAQCLGFKDVDVSAIKDFKFGSKTDTKPTLEYKELLELSEKVHLNCMDNLDQMADEDLKEDNKLGFSFGGDKSKITIIMHHLRHLGMHTGHLSLLCKINKIKTF